MRSPRSARLLFAAFLLPAAACLLSASAQTVVADKPEFRQLVPADATVEKLAGGFRFVEGPAWNPVEKFLVFSDNVDDRIYRWNAATKTAPLWRHPSGMSNGNLYTDNGDFYSCEQDPHRVSITHPDGTREESPDTWEGKALSSPNDIAVKSDGTVWFTDPPFGLGKRKQEQPTNNVYCWNPKTREMRVVASDFSRPNGLCFSPDESKLYISDTDRQRQHVRVYKVGAENQITGGEVFCQLDKGVPDGIRCDTAGNLWSSAGDGVQVFNPAGERLGKILVPESPANLCFGGVDAEGKRELFMTARTSLYRVKVTAEGAAVPKRP